MITTEPIIKKKDSIPETPGTDQQFEKKYLATRQKENRVYTDEEVALLPSIANSHPHQSEWKIRGDSARLLANYLEKKNRVLSILEVGCGNGWLSHRLALVPGSTVTGIDINFMELQQAGRVFSGQKNLQFIYGNILSGIGTSMTYDIIVFAASIQYFSHFAELIRKMQKLLGLDGEIHILDSPFYKPEEIGAAKKRTADHYASLGQPDMSYHYFHHSLAELKSIEHKLIHRPSFLDRIINKNKNPFPWIMIKGAKE